MPMERDGVATNHYEVGPRVGELDEQISKVLGKLGHVSRHLMNRQGIS